MNLLTRVATWLAGGLLLFAAVPALAGTITGSAHDFTGQAWSGGRICVACHAPHKTDTATTDAPLWSHANSTATYTLYSTPTMNATRSPAAARNFACPATTVRLR